MLDSRFETAADDAKHLLSAMDIDELDELATFLMVLFMRPVVVEEVRDIEADAPGLEIILGGNEHAVGTTYHFPGQCAGARARFRRDRERPRPLRRRIRAGGAPGPVRPAARTVDRGTPAPSATSASSPCSVTTEDHNSDLLE